MSVTISVLIRTPNKASYIGRYFISSEYLYPYRAKEYADTSTTEPPKTVKGVIPNVEKKEP